MIGLLCFFFNDTATTEIYTLSLHDALPICLVAERGGTVVCGGRSGVMEAVARGATEAGGAAIGILPEEEDRKSTRLNSSHANISYAVFCLKKKKTNKTLLRTFV